MPLDSMNRSLTATIAEARAQIAAGQEPDTDALERRIRAAALAAKSGGHAADPTEVADAERKALKQLERVIAVHRARQRLARAPEPTPAPVPTTALPRRRAALVTRPTISGNMDVRREAAGDSATLLWDSVPAVSEWEVRFSERPDPRAEYVVRESLTLPADTTTVELPLGDFPLRVHLLGRSRDGRLLRRALISSLTRETWNERWQRRSSAS